MLSTFLRLRTAGNQIHRTVLFCIHYRKMFSVEDAKRKASEAAIEDWLQDGQIIGIGSGTTVEYAVEAVARKAKLDDMKVKCVPTSFQAKELILRYGLNLTTLDACDKLDVAFDGADEVCSDLTLIKGGGGCLLQEKIVASCAHTFIVLVDERKCSKRLGTRWTKGLPIEVIPMAYRAIQTRIEEILGGHAVLRPAGTKMGPQITDNGNFLLDWIFDMSRDYNWPEVDVQLIRIPGVVETGLFIGMARRVYVGNMDGSIKTLELT